MLPEALTTWTECGHALSLQGGHLSARKFAAGTTKTSRRPSPQLPLLRRMGWQAPPCLPPGWPASQGSCFDDKQGCQPPQPDPISFVTPDLPGCGTTACPNNTKLLHVKYRPDIARQRLAYARTKSYPSLAQKAVMDALSTAKVSDRHMVVDEGFETGLAEAKKCSPTE